MAKRELKGWDLLASVQKEMVDESMRGDVGQWHAAELLRWARLIMIAAGQAASQANDECEAGRR
jgi:hypothetical protein